MLAGDFRFIWHQLSGVCGVEDGLDPAADVSLEDKISARRSAAHTFFNVTCQDREAVIAALDKMNIAWGDVRPADQITALATVTARGSVAEVDDRAGGTRSIPQSPYRFRHLDAQVQGGARRLGEDNEAVLADWLALSEEEKSRYNDVLVTGEQE